MWSYVVCFILIFQSYDKMQGSGGNVSQLIHLPPRPACLVCHSTSRRTVECHVIYMEVFEETHETLMLKTQDLTCP